MHLDDGDNGRRLGGIYMDKKDRLRRDRATAAEVSAQLSALVPMTAGELAERYREIFGEPTHSRNKDYLHKKIAWRIQELSEGGLSPRALAKIEELAPQAPARWRSSKDERSAVSQVSGVRPTIERDPRLPAPGSVIVRRYKGIEHRVNVLEDGLEYNGERYVSLSRIARIISGTSWNGFLFFGLSKRRAAAAQDRQE
jgi:hypothetical protein